MGAARSAGGRTGPSSAISSALLDRAGAAPVGAREAAEEAGEEVDLLFAVMLEEQPPDAADVGTAGLAELLVALLGELRVGDPGVAGARDALDQPVATSPSTSRVIPERVSIVLSASADIGSRWSSLWARYRSTS